MAVTYTTIANKTTNYSSGVNDNFTALSDALDTTLQNTGAQTVTGAKTFSNATIVGMRLQMAEISDPTAVANKLMLYTNDDSGVTNLYARNSDNITQITSSDHIYDQPTIETGADATVASGDTLVITHSSDTDLKRKVGFYKAVTGGDALAATVDYGTLAKVDRFDCKQTAYQFQVDTANTSGHFERVSGNTISLGTGNTCPYIMAGCRFAVSGDSTVYDIVSISGTGSADNAVMFTRADGTTPTKATGTYALSYVYGTTTEGTTALNESLTETTSWSVTLNSDDDVNRSNASFRTYIPASVISTSGTQVRVTFVAAIGFAFALDHASIALCSSGADAAETPTELLFSGASGFSIAAGQTITSDWTTFTLTESSGYLVISDLSSASTNRPRRRAYGGTYQTYYKASTDSYNVADVSGFVQVGSNYIYCINKIEVRNSTYPTTSIYTVTTNDAGQIDCSGWSDMNSATASEDLNSQTAYYATSFDDRITWKVNTTGAWRSIARLNTATWEYNSNATYGSTTWTSATINSAQGSLSQAFSIASNRMTGTQLGAISDANWNAAGGWTASADTLDFAIGLSTASSATTPVVDKITISYSTDAHYEPIHHDGTTWTIECADTTTTLTHVSGTSVGVKGVVKIYI